MAAVTLTRKTETLQGFQLNSPAAMREALQYLSSKGYAGNINCDIGGTWTLGLMSPGHTTNVNGGIGDWIVMKNGEAAEVVSAAAFASLYDIT